MTPSAAPRLRRALLRAGAFGAQSAAQTGLPQLGLSVPVHSADELLQALRVLEHRRLSATLLIPAALALQEAATVRAAAQAGHEIAGTGSAAGLAALDVAACQSVAAWEAGETEPGWAGWQALAARGVRPLPLPGPTPQPGQTVRIAPAELAARLDELHTNGFRPSPVRELSGLRRATPRDLLLHVYAQTVEANFTRQHHVIDLTQRADGVMRVAPLPSAPDPLPLPRTIPTAELHLDSARIVGLAARGALGAYRAYLRSLKDVGRALQERPELHGAQAVFAVTLFYAPLEQAGFTLLELPPARARVYALGFRVLRLVHGTTQASSVLVPKMAWLPRDEFLKRYG
ncbi:YkoP family protein [Deinococcus koreensis]|uniref:Sectered polysaccharide deacetylase n=1 Tax=Deinococcus koreensis TaxID=2054903 RepID=A0A2K3UZK6_9DEIO|nr:Sectered polysaccharide deacetylase [Deinococcus koreensis]PNY81961.1 Sectered polysaccharide deacetylase [Deinococcus koreensis]